MEERQRDEPARAFYPLPRRIRAYQAHHYLLCIQRLEARSDCTTTSGLAGKLMEKDPKPPVLPPEILDIIISFLHDDKPALLSCAEVGRSLLCGSRSYICNSLTVVQENIESFLNVLEYADCTFLPFTRKLNIGLHSEVSSEIACSVELFYALRRFSVLEFLIINVNGLAWDALMSSLPARQAHLPLLKRLHIKEIAYSDLTFLPIILPAMPFLQVLTLESVTCRSVSWGSLNVDSAWPETLRGLYLDASNPVEILEGLMARPTLPIISTFRITCVWWKSSRLLASFYAASVPT